MGDLLNPGYKPSAEEYRHGKHWRGSLMGHSFHLLQNELQSLDFWPQVHSIWHRMRWLTKLYFCFSYGKWGTCIYLVYFIKLLRRYLNDFWKKNLNYLTYVVLAQNSYYKIISKRPLLHGKCLWNYCKFWGKERKMMWRRVQNAAESLRGSFSDLHA